MSRTSLWRPWYFSLDGKTVVFAYHHVVGAKKTPGKDNNVTNSEAETVEQWKERRTTSTEYSLAKVLHSPLAWNNTVSMLMATAL